MQAITTKYLPATNTKGARIKASCEAGSVTISYPHEAQRGHLAHAQAVYALAEKLGWPEYSRPEPGLCLASLRFHLASIEFAPGEWVFLPSNCVEWS